MSGEAGDSPIADFYGLLAELLSFPRSGLAAALRGGEVRGDCRTHPLALLRVELSVRAQRPWADRASPTRTWSPNTSACSTCRTGRRRRSTPGVYAPRRRDAMEELLRIYRHFGLTIRRTPPRSSRLRPNGAGVPAVPRTRAGSAEDAGREPFLAATARHPRAPSRAVGGRDQHSPGEAERHPFYRANRHRRRGRRR